MLIQIKPLLIILAAYVLTLLCSCNNNNIGDDGISNDIENNNSCPNQTEMNITSYQNYLKADSILNHYYEQVIKRYDALILEEKHTSERMPDYDQEYLDYLKLLKKSIEDNHISFLLYRESLENMISNKYTTGTILPMMLNSYNEQVSINQAELLKELFSESISTKE